MRRTMTTAVAAGALALLTVAPPVEARAKKDTQAVLEGRAVLPADTFAAGPPSGTQLGSTAINGRTPPFPSQPVQGFSAVVRAGRHEFLAMPDNGYGRKGNSADFLLRVYRIRPDFETARSGTGTVAVLGHVGLSDPDHHIQVPIVNDLTTDRLLTGADFDIESMRVVRDGTMWFGDEFGPYLLHTDAGGRLLAPPIPLPGVSSPQNPTLAPGESPTLPASRGFEGMALSRDGRSLYPMLEGPLVEEADKSVRRIYRFDLRWDAYTGEVWLYRTEAPTHAVPELVALDKHRLLVIERDTAQGVAAQFKKVYLVDLRRSDRNGHLVKHEVADLLAIRDPHRISLPALSGDTGLGDPFSFPFETTEALLPLGHGRMLVMNDNNYPFSAGRNPNRPDDNEMIVIRATHLKAAHGRG